MTAHSLRILWRQTYNESLEDKGNTGSRVFLSEGFLPYIICDGLRVLWLENRKYKLAVRSHLSERGSYSGLTLLGLPGGLTVVSDVLRARCIALTFQRGWDAIILLFGSVMKWKIPFCTSERDPPLSCTLRPVSLHHDGVHIRGTLMKAGRLHTRCPLTTLHWFLQWPRTRGRVLDAKCLEDTVTHTVCGSAQQQGTIDITYCPVAMHHLKVRGRNGFIRRSPRLLFPSFWRLDLERKTGDLTPPPKKKKLNDK